MMIGLASQKLETTAEWDDCVRLLVGWMSDDNETTTANATKTNNKQSKCSVVLTSRVPTASHTRRPSNQPTPVTSQPRQLSIHFRLQWLQRGRLARTTADTGNYCTTDPASSVCWTLR